MVNKSDPLYQIFEKFSKFGVRDVPLNHPPPIAGGKKDPMIMDGARFAKLARDCSIIDNIKVDSTEVDLIFNKVKTKTERKINFEQFVAALHLLAKKKYGETAVEPEQGLDKLKDLILACPGPILGPVTTALPPKLNALTRFSLDAHHLKAPKPLPAPRYSLKPETTHLGPSVFDRLTDTRLYTGTQKQKALDAKLQGHNI